jgi:hypothetical protein
MSHSSVIFYSTTESDIFFHHVCKVPLFGVVARRGWCQNVRTDETKWNIGYSDFRFRSIFKHSLPKVRFSLCAGLVEKRFEVHDLYKHQEVHMNVFYNPCNFQLSRVQGKLFPVWSPASGHAIFATDFSDSLLKCMANDRYAFVRAIDSLPCLAFGVGKRDRITTCNISLDRYLKKEINWREKKISNRRQKFWGSVQTRNLC